MSALYNVEYLNESCELNTVKVFAQNEFLSKLWCSLWKNSNLIVSSYTESNADIKE